MHVSSNHSSESLNTGPSRLSGFVRSFNLLLTARGFLLLIFVGLLFLGPVSTENDIIASVFAYVLLAVIALSIIFTVVQGVRLRRTLRVSLHSPSEGDSGETVFSGTTTRFLLRTSPIELAPFFVLTIQPEFEYSGVVPSLHRLVGSSRRERFLNEMITFPHRGDWNIIRITATLGDQMGFTQLRWEMHPNPAQVFRIEPPVTSETRLPILSSCQRSGDLITATQDRLGDPFDLKSYHPSDGLKKVVWKIFARTGELVARHPEHSMTPEGQVILYCAARPQDDHVCSSAIAYMKQLRDLDLELFFGCDGLAAHTPARTVNDATSLMIETVWNNSSDESDLRALLEYTSQQLLESRIDKVILFAPKEGLEDEAFRERLVQLATFLESRRITPVFYMVENPLSHATAEEVRAPLETAAARLRRWFFEGDETPAALDPGHFQRFAGLCSQRNWGVFA